jgi:hypothetical protein
MNGERNLNFDDAMLDRLADGELSDDEYQALVRSLDAQPAGWRRCALAFLESQAWRRELGGPLNDPAPLVQPRAASAFRWSWSWGGLMTLASAASFLLAFLLAARMFQPPGPDAGPSAGLVRGGPAERPDEMLAATDSTDGHRPWGAYRIVLDTSDGQPQQIEMPIYAPDDPRASWLFNERATMPAELILALQRMGFEVDRQRQWAPVVQNAGEPVLVPIEELRITPVSSRSYQ